MKLAKDKVSFKIRLAVFQAGGGADPPPAEHLKPNLCLKPTGDPAC